MKLVNFSGEYVNPEAVAALEIHYAEGEPNTAMTKIWLIGGGGERGFVVYGTVKETAERLAEAIHRKSGNN